MTILSEANFSSAAAGDVAPHAHSALDQKAPFPAVCAHRLFESQAALTPDACAIVHGDRQLTYGELNASANKLAHRLRRSGLGPDVLAGVCLPRTPELVVALLAVWKAGGAYIPLDPTYPAERLTFMCADARAVLVLTQSDLAGLITTDAAATIMIDRDWPEIAAEPDANLEDIAAPSHLAYVMFTSGSTGRPKGAMIQHDGLVNYLWWAKHFYSAGPGAPAPVHTSISFDLTVTSLFTPLIAGGTVELLPDEAGAQSLVAALMREKDRTLVKITPAHLELLTQQLTPQEAIGATRLFVIGGENLLADNLSLWRGRTPPTRLVNEYGPTETVVGCCIHEIADSDPHSGAVPIGRPIANTQLYILDEEMQPVERGRVGELYIGGIGVGRGYINRPELTAERFLPDLFSPRANARLYKSGDLARMRANGVLEYLGRADDQVKVRGYRIELGEIEAALAAHPAVQMCTVRLREDVPGDKQLVAYVVSRAGAVAEADDFRAVLADGLPAHMIPTHFVRMAALPLTANGKVDRNALPAPSVAVASPATAKGGAPRTATEVAVAAIWRELLKKEDIGVDVDFFDAGGHSLSATAMLQRLRAAFAVDVRLASLFENPTIAGIAETIDALVVTAAPADAAAGAVEREEITL